MKLEDLEIYKLAREISKEAWEIYQEFDWQTKKIIGDQFITAIDSIGANIAEGSGRFHFADRNKFSYNARGSLLESLHWSDAIIERKLAESIKTINLKNKLEQLHLKLNNFINSTKKQAHR